MKLNKFAYLYSKLLRNHTLRTRMHSSRMRTTCSSSCPGGSPPGTPFCYGLLVWWPSVMAFWPPRRPYQKAAFNQKATKPEGHNRRPQQKAIAEGHTPQSRHPAPWSRHPRNRHPPEQAHPEQAPPRAGTHHPPHPLEQAPHPPGADPPWRPAASYAGIPPAMHARIVPPC